MGLFLPPPAEVLPTPAGLVVGTAFGDDDVFRILPNHHYCVVRFLIFVFHNVAGPELLPAWTIYPPPWEVTDKLFHTESF